MEQRSTPVRLSSAISGAGNKNRTLARDISESLGKLPPQAPDLEEAILGALMLEKKALTDVVEFLRPEHFIPISIKKFTLLSLIFSSLLSRWICALLWLNFAKMENLKL